MRQRRLGWLSTMRAHVRAPRKPSSSLSIPTILTLVIFLTGLLVPAVAASRSQESAVPLRFPDNAAPTFSVFTSRDGLSDEIWSAVGVDVHGFVWPDPRPRSRGSTVIDG